MTVCLEVHFPGGRRPDTVRDFRELRGTHGATSPQSRVAKRPLTFEAGVGAVQIFRHLGGNPHR